MEKPAPPSDDVIAAMADAHLLDGPNASFRMLVRPKRAGAGIVDRWQPPDWKPFPRSFEENPTTTIPGPLGNLSKPFVQTICAADPLRPRARTDTANDTVREGLFGAFGLDAEKEKVREEVRGVPAKTRNTNQHWKHGMNTEHQPLALAH